MKFCEDGKECNQNIIYRDFIIKTWEIMAFVRLDTGVGYTWEMDSDQQKGHQIQEKATGRKMNEKEQNMMIHVHEKV